MIPAWSDWAGAIAAGVRGVPDADIVRAAYLILDADVVLTAGNGGSASLASHMAQAIMKPSYGPGGRAAVCLPDSIPTMTAHANDGGWENALAELGRPFFERHESISVALVVFSSSGKSRNVVQLAQLALDHGCPIVAFTGFDGGPLRAIATVSLHVNSSDYEVIEPVHDALLHRVQAHLRELGRRGDLNTPTDTV